MFDGNINNNIVAFGPDGETDCRAIGTWLEEPELWYFTIVGNINGEEISFKIYEDDKVYDCNQTLTFEDNATIGTPRSPYQIESIDEIVFDNYRISNFPNPFNNSTTISFSIKEESHVKLSIYNTKGELISTLIDEEMNSNNNHQIIWDGKSGNTELANGIYLYQLRLDNKIIETKKMVLTK